MAMIDDVKAQIADAKNATDNIAADVTRILAKIQDILDGQAGAVDAAVTAALTEVQNDLTPLVSQLQGVAAEVPEDAPEPEPTPEP